MYDTEDTIVGLASAVGRGPRGVVRLSGPRVITCLTHAFSCATKLSSLRSAQVLSAAAELPSPLGAIPGELYVWPTSRSYTRQPAAEFHTIGAQPLLDAISRHLCCRGARLAQPGEFTLRAFLAGRLDLTQAEAVLGVIDAHDEDALKVALGQLAGGIGTPLAELRSDLLELLAHLEAGLDFVEEDIEFITRTDLTRQLNASALAVEQIVQQLSTRGEHASFASVVFEGSPNAGKSSLFNAISGSDVALVSSEPGTTRDYLARRVDLDGLLVEFVDTAGLHAVGATDAVEASSQRVATEQHQRAALRLLCIDAGDAGSVDLIPPSSHDQLIVLTKSDLLDVSRSSVHYPEGCLLTSAKQATGIQSLLLAVRERLVQQVVGSSLAVPSTTLRCHQSLASAAECLRSASLVVEGGRGEELVALELRLALDELGDVLGAVYTDDILDRIFSRFCIGK